MLTRAKTCSSNNDESLQQIVLCKYLPNYLLITIQNPSLSSLSNAVDRRVNYVSRGKTGIRADFLNTFSQCFSGRETASIYRPLFFSIQKNCRFPFSMNAFPSGSILADFFLNIKSYPHIPQISSDYTKKSRYIFKV